jgi:hypothetical protein
MPWRKQLWNKILKVQCALFGRAMYILLLRQKGMFFGVRVCGTFGFSFFGQTILVFPHFPSSTSREKSARFLEVIRSARFLKVQDRCKIPASPKFSLTCMYVIQEVIKRNCMCTIQNVIHIVQLPRLHNYKNGCKSLIRRVQNDQGTWPCLKSGHRNWMMWSPE